MPTMTAVAVSVLAVASGLDAGGVTPPPSNVFLNQVFSGTPGTPITSLVPTVGGAWSAQTGTAPATPSVINTAGTALYSTTTMGIYQNATANVAADYYVEAVFTALSINADNVGVCIRADPAANIYYFVRWSASSWGIFKTIAGVTTAIGNTFADTWTAGQSKTIRLAIAGTTLTASVNGSAVMTGTDNAIAAAGEPGIRMVTVTTGTTSIHIVSIIAST